MDRPSPSYTGTMPGVGKGKKPVARRKLLIVDDDRAFVVLAAAILRDAGFMVLEAHDARQGFLYAQQIPPEVILLDMNMPAGGGMSLLQKMQSIQSLSRIPIIVVTADTDEGLAELVRSKGAADLLTKPVDRDRLLALVNAVLTQQPKPPTR